MCVRGWDGVEAGNLLQREQRKGEWHGRGKHILSQTDWKGWGDGEQGEDRDLVPFLP